MTKTVVDCGNCGPDFNAIRNMLKASFDVKVVQTHGPEDTLEFLRANDVVLVTVNRKLDRDYSDGMEVIRLLKADSQTASVPVMLITNYDEHQQAAMEIGALQGFGKLSLNEPQTFDRLQAVLG